MPEPRIADSAHKHGLGSADITHALRNRIIVKRGEDSFTMVIGPARDATLIEVGYVESSDGSPVVIHAMRARPKFLR